MTLRRLREENNTRIVGRCHSEAAALDLSPPASHRAHQKRGMRVLRAIIPIVVLSGCVSAPSSDPADYRPNASTDFQPYSLTRVESEQVEADVRAHLQTPDALFAGLQAAKAGNGDYVVCGWVRQRDFDRPHIRYPLNRPFVASYSGGPTPGANSIYFASERSQAGALYTFCSQRGISM